MPSQVTNKSWQAPPGTAVADALEIRAVCTRRELSDFIRLPWQLYSEADNWVPPLISERRSHLSRTRSPFFEPILENWHHPYYAELFEGAGMQKAMDLYKWQILTAEHDRVLPIVYELADSLEAKHGIRVRNMRRRDFEDEVQRFMEIYNAAWEGNWGFVPLTQSELKAYAKELKPVLDERYAYIAETDEEIVGAALTLPDINKVLAKLNGRLLPFGWLKILRECRRIDELCVFALGVKREYRHTGTAAAFYAEHWRECLASEDSPGGDWLDPRDE